MTELAALVVPLETAAAPEWIELIPAGNVVAGFDGRTWRNPRPEGVIAASAVSATRPLPIDWEHATEVRGPQGLDAPAAGWIEALELRGGSVWGRVSWTETGRNQVAARQYRFVSPVFTFVRASGEIIRLKSVGLTNTPNLTLTALNSVRICNALQLTAEQRFVAQMFDQDEARFILSRQD